MNGLPCKHTNDAIQYVAVMFNIWNSLFFTSKNSFIFLVSFSMVAVCVFLFCKGLGKRKTFVSIKKRWKKTQSVLSIFDQVRTYTFLWFLNIHLTIANLHKPQVQQDLHRRQWIFFLFNLFQGSWSQSKQQWLLSDAHLWPCFIFN